MAVETPSRPGTGSYGLYWVLLMAACDLGRRLADQRGHLADDAGVLRRLGPREQDLLCGMFDTSTVPLRSTIWPRGAGTLTTRTWLRVTAAA